METARKTERSLFSNGSVWLKADFHLHTKADKEFKYDGEDTDFSRLYVEQLKQQDIGIGIITNHNKFDKNEFVALKKKAKKEDIWLIPGIEFSLKEGIHLLIAFENKWYQGQGDQINEFITSSFLGVDNYAAPPYPDSKFSLLFSKETIEVLDQIGLDYFCVMAHVDDTNGLFTVLKGRTLKAFVLDDSFSRVIGLQKSGNKKNYTDLCKITNRKIACVEGSDNAQKGIEAVGTGRTTYVKVGSHNFQALKYALTDPVHRISPQNKPKIKNTYIKSISFEGGLLDKIKIDLSPELNNFIGIRGSGKSSILEILRYTLGISLGEQASDRNYKNDLIEYVLKSGGKIITTVVGEHQKEYRIKKIYEHEADVYDNNRRLDIPSIETVFKKPIYFGQKDLSNKHIDFEADLVKKLVGDKLDGIKEKINGKSFEIKDIISKLKRLEDLTEHKEEVEKRISNAEYNLNIFRKKGIEEKLKRQSAFDTDILQFEATNGNVAEFQNELDGLYDNYKSLFVDSQFSSEENKDIFDQINVIFKSICKEFQKLNNIHENIANHQKELTKLYEKLADKKEKLKEEFAKIKREIDIPDLNPDKFLKLKRVIKTSSAELAEIEKSEKQKANLNKSLSDRLAELNNLWHEEYQILEEEVARINQYENTLSILVVHKGREDKFREKLEQVCKGSGIRKNVYDTIMEKYKDFVAIYRNFASLNKTTSLSESGLVEFKNRFNSHLEELLTFRVVDKFTINYNQKPLIQHSLGQRATALILFLLAQRETNVLIIDQPEDDLDNQTIYEDVIKELKSLKGEMQFIFATHNPNIPVLGDSEKIISCEYSESKIETTFGTIDSPNIQKQIVTIMEGGEEAFDRRNNIYNIWSNLKSQ